MIQNGGRDLSPLYCDEYLLERLRLLATDSTTPKKVQNLTRNMFIGWSEQFKGQREYERLVVLQKQVPMKKKRARPQPKYLSNDPRDLEEDDDNDTDNNNDNHYGGGTRSRSASTSEDHSRSGPPPIPPSSSKPRMPTTTTSHKKSKSHSSRSNQQPVVRKLDMAKEKPLILNALAEASSAATNLTNALQFIDWSKELSTENKNATECFNKCRKLRKSILRYIHSVESEEFLGPLIDANDHLISALKRYDEMSRPQDYDSDSDSDYEQDDWKVDADRGRHEGSSSGAGPSTRRNNDSDDEDDEDNPFGDSNAI